MTSEEIVVIGAGAAGLMAAIAAGRSGAKVLVLEKNKKAGVKILMSGGSRCNITHDCDNIGIIKAFGPRGKFLHSALASFGTRDTVAFFEAAGVPTKVEETGKVFPVSNRAHHVLDALIAESVNAGARISLLEPCRGLEVRGENLVVITPEREIEAKAVILTTGGKSFPGCGTTGDGYALASMFGHQIIPTRPALVPLALRETWVAQLAGMTMGDVGLALEENGHLRGKTRGSNLFTHLGVSGPAPLNLTRFPASWECPQGLSLLIDFLPGLALGEVDEWLRQETNSRGRQLVSVVMSDRLPRGLADRLLVETGLEPDRRAAGLSRDQRLTLAKKIKNLRFGIQRTLGFEKAEVTSGGVDLREVDSRSMQSLIIPSLYFAGEILDLDGPIGGFNFQAAWSTGWLAGIKASAKLAKMRP